MDSMEELAKAMRAEKDPSTRARMMAVRGVLAGLSTADVAIMADVTQRAVQLWVEKFEDGGIDGLRDSPGRGSRPKIRYRRVARLADRLAKKQMLTPRKLVNWVKNKLGTRYSVGSIRRILRQLGFSVKTSVTSHSNAADAGTVRQWQKDAKAVISGAKRRGFRIVVQDESIFQRTGSNGRKLWSRINDRVRVPRYGSRGRIVVYGALADDGTRLMRTYDAFDAETFVQYLREVRRKWGRALIIMDNARQHKSRAADEYLEGCDDIGVLYLPVATPELSAVESIWKDAKYKLITSTHYDTLEDLKHAVSEYFRTCTIKVDIYTYLERSL